MTLHEVNTREQFFDYYKSKNLHSIEEKIEDLRKVMDVKAVRCAEGGSKENTLAVLEEFALCGEWEIS